MEEWVGNFLIRKETSIMKYRARDTNIGEAQGITKEGDRLDSSVFLPIGVEITPNLGELENQKAVTVGYVNDKLLNLSGEFFTLGIVQKERIPAFTGDLIKPESNNSTVIVNSIVSPGTYTKVTVNTKGIIITGSSLVEGDIPNIPWNKLKDIQNKSLSDYGILDALSLSGGQMSGPLKVAISNEPDDLLNKQTMDEINAITGFMPGAMVLKLGDKQVPHWLRCNGGEVLKTSYADLYNAIGDSFSVSYSPGFGLPHLLQSDFNTSSTVTAGWTSRGTLPDRINSGKTLVTKNKVYLLGGSNGTGSTSSLNTIYKCSIVDATGAIGSWSLNSYLPIEVDSFELVVNVNRVYLIGGRTNGTDITSIYSCLIDELGDLGVWTLIGNLPFVLSNMSALVTKNILTIIGGTYNGTGVLNVMQAKINVDGTLGDWYSCPSLPAVRFKTSMFVAKNFVYLLGGSNGSLAVSTILKTTISPTGLLGEWVFEGQIPDTLQDTSIVCTANRVYLLGGGDQRSSDTSNKVYTAPINPDGTLGTWSTGSNLSEAVRCAQVFITSTRLHIAGGYRSTTRINAVRSCNFTGGLNNYSVYYSLKNRATDNDYFRLPDISDIPIGTNCYIKY